MWSIWNFYHDHFFEKTIIKILWLKLKIPWSFQNKFKKRGYPLKLRLTFWFDIIIKIKKSIFVYSWIAFTFYKMYFNKISNKGRYD